MDRTGDENEPVWTLCDFIRDAPNKRAAELRFENCCVICKADAWALRILADAWNDDGEDE